MGAYAGLLWRQRLVLLGALLLVVFATVGGWQVAPRSYTATSTLDLRDDRTLNLEPVDIADFSNSVLLDATKTDLLTEVASKLAVHRSVTTLRQEITATWDSDLHRVTITVEDRDSRTALQVAGTVGSLLPTYAADLGIVAFTATPAVIASSAVVPLVWVVAIAFIGLAWFLALLYAGRRDRQTNIVTGAAQVESALEVPLLAHMRMPRDPTVLPALTPGSSAADPFRHVRAALGLAGHRVDRRVGVGGGSPGERSVKRLVVTSAPVRGQTQVWVATNLSVSLAQDGWRVLLVDGRLGPRFGPALPGEPVGPGLREVLDGTDLDAAMHPGPVPGLSVMTAGARQDADGLLTAPGFADVVTQAQRHVDVVVVVTPALSVCDDALVMATPGSLLLTVPEGRVTLDALRTVGSRVRSTMPRLLGSVLVGRLSERAHV